MFKSKILMILYILLFMSSQGLSYASDSDTNEPKTTLENNAEETPGTVSETIEVNDDDKTPTSTDEEEEEDCD